MLMLFLSACANDAELDTLEPQGKFADKIDSMITPIFYIAIVVFIIVFAIVLFAWWRFRVKDYADGDWPAQTHGNTRLEILWTIIPALILVGIGAPSINTLFKVNSKVKDPEVTVVVVGQQWWWEFRYYLGDKAKQYSPKDHKIDGLEPDLVTAGQIVIPTGKEIQLHITSRDVIHSFWIPALNGKKDAVPGRFSPWKLHADEPGVYFGQCTEFCGLSHSRMRMQAVGVSPDDFIKWIADQQKPYVPASKTAQDWLAEQKSNTTKKAADPNFKAPTGAAAKPEPTATAVERGMVIFRNVCTKCHLANGVNDDIFTEADQVSRAAPKLTHFASRTTYAGGIFNLYNADGTVDRNQLEAWLRNPPAEKDAYPDGKRGMPNLGLSEDQINDLVEFLLSTGTPPNKDVTIPATEVK